MVQAIEDAAKKQEAGLGGVTEQKEREETELEDADYILAQAVALWLTDNGREAEAGEIDLTKSAWQGLRDQQLLTKSKLVIERAEGRRRGTGCRGLRHHRRRHRRAGSGIRGLRLHH